ncbi:MAG: MFS transporter [Saprospiraceae bacterium]|nr:MFS transporter [Saprospiraceae bacterium]
MLVNRMGAMVLPFMTLYLTTSLNFSYSQAGLIMSAYGAGSILGAYTGGFLSDRYNYYTVQLWSLIGGSALLFLIPVLHNFYLIAACIFMFSLISDMLRPANSVAIAAYSKPDTRVRSFSLMRLSINLGFAIGPALGGLIATTAGYPWIFVFDGVTCLLAALLIVFYLNYKPSSSPTVDDENNFTTPNISAYKDKRYLLFIMVVMLYAILFFQLFTTVPVFLKKEVGYDDAVIGLFMALNGLLIVIIEMPLIQNLNKNPKSFSYIGYGFLLLSVSFTFLILQPQTVLFILLYVLFITFSEMLAMPFMTNYAISRPTVSRQGQYMALYAMAYGMAHIIAPTASFFIAEKFDYFVLYYIVIVLSIVGGILFSDLINQGFGDNF